MQNSNEESVYFRIRARPQPTDWVADYFAVLVVPEWGSFFLLLSMLLLKIQLKRAICEKYSWNYRRKWQWAASSSRDRLIGKEERCAKYERKCIYCGTSGFVVWGAKEDRGEANRRWQLETVEEQKGAPEEEQFDWGDRGSVDYNFFQQSVLSVN